MLSKPVENTVGKVEIARYEQFLLFPQCFQTAFFSEASKGVLVWEWVKTIRTSSQRKSHKKNVPQRQVAETLSQTITCLPSAQ